VNNEGHRFHIERFNPKKFKVWKIWAQRSKLIALGK
jgi:hypothetical protein